MIKKILAMAMVLVCVFMFFGCNSNSNSNGAVGSNATSEKYKDLTNYDVVLYDDEYVTIKLVNTFWVKAITSTRAPDSPTEYDF